MQFVPAGLGDESGICMALASGRMQQKAAADGGAGPARTRALAPGGLLHLTTPSRNVKLATASPIPYLLY